MSCEWSFCSRLLGMASRREVSNLTVWRSPLALEVPCLIDRFSSSLESFSYPSVQRSPFRIISNGRILTNNSRPFRRTSTVAVRVSASSPEPSCSWHIVLCVAALLMPYSTWTVYCSPTRFGKTLLRRDLGRLFPDEVWEGPYPTRSLA